MAYWQPSSFLDVDESIREILILGCTKNINLHCCTEIGGVVLNLTAQPFALFAKHMSNPKTMNHKNNNFDFLRLVFASFVVITHSYPLTGVEECDVMCQLTNGQVSLSYIGVKGFFVLSGYLIFQSLQRSKNVIDYFWKRFLRLFPALFVVLLLTVFLVPFVYQGNDSIVNNSSLFTYLPNNLMLYRLQYSIKGVFENNPYKSVINGSLWTIPYEFTMYVLLSFLILFRRNKRVVQIMLVSLFLLLLVGRIFFFSALKHYSFILSAQYLFDLGIFFIAGSLLAAIDVDQINRKKELLLLTAILVTAAVVLGFYSFSRYVTLPVLFILFGLNPIPFICNIGKKLGDLSYGVYIYGFPVQQTLVFYFHLDHLALMICSLIISFLLAFLSWHFVEKKALQLKSRAIF